VSDESAAKPSPTVAPSTLSRPGSFSIQDAMTAALLVVGLASIFALTRSRWLDDYDSVNFAFALDDFDVTRQQPHAPGYPIYVAAGKLIHLVIADYAAALTLVSSLAGAAVAAMFYILARRQLDWLVALAATVVMALSALFWLQSGLALTDMFGMIFVLAFLLVEGASPQTQQGDLVRRSVSGLIAGLSLGARPHVTLVIVAYWCIRALLSRPVKGTHVLTAAASFSVGVVAWLLPACLFTGGLRPYLSACLTQFEWRLDKPAVSVLGAPISGSYLMSRAGELIGWLGQTFAPVKIATTSHIVRQTALALAVLLPYVFFAWRSASKAVARPYILASAVYLLMLFILLPIQHQRYFLPFCLIIGWSVGGVLALFKRPVVRGVALLALLAVTIVPSILLVRGLSEVPPPVAALAWAESRSGSILYSTGLLRHAMVYWPKGDIRPKPETEAECADFRKGLASGRPVLSTSPGLCGVDGKESVSFKRDPRVHDKHHFVTIFEFGDRTP
jgi:hypothetical protein